MARTIQELYNQIVNEKDTMPRLVALLPASDSYSNLIAAATSTSKVADWRLWSFIAATVIHDHEVVFDLHKAEVENLAARASVGTLPWYYSKVLEFQYSATTQYWLDVTPALDGGLVIKYNIVNPDDRIIRRASCNETAEGRLLIKVATGTETSLAPLSSAQQLMLAGYLNQLKIAGTKLDIRSQAADLIRIALEIRYDAIYNQDLVKTAVEAAINSYLKSLDFDGRFYTIRLIDYIQAVPGVVDVVLGNIILSPSLPVFQSTTFVSGYVEIDPSHPLDTTLSYVAV